MCLKKYIRYSLTLALGKQRYFACGNVVQENLIVKNVLKK